MNVNERDGEEGRRGMAGREHAFKVPPPEESWTGPKHEGKD